MNQIKTTNQDSATRQQLGDIKNNTTDTTQHNMETTKMSQEKPTTNTQKNLLKSLQKTKMSPNNTHPTCTVKKSLEKKKILNVKKQQQYIEIKH